MKKSFLVASILILGLVLCIAAFLVLPKLFKAKETGTVTAQIGIHDVGPMMGGMVFFVNTAGGPPPSATRYWRVPTHSFPLGKNARFTATLPAGDYYMGAIERDSGESPAPPGEGEYYFISQDEQGKPRTYSVRKNEVLDLGDLMIRAVPFKRSLIAKKGITSVQGALRDEKGVAVAGMLVFAYSDPAMAEAPLFVSERSDKQGKYILRLAGGGTYYLQARHVQGGATPSGVYENGKAVSVETAEAKTGIDISVRTADAPAPAR